MNKENIFPHNKDLTLKETIKNPKIIAFYLPQFHAIPENDEWWGEGFTEWVNVRKAKPLFCGHVQPHIPLNNNYYDLLNPTTFAWQTDIAKKYNVDAFCFYHYWFNGKLLLEKPLDLFLNHPEWDRDYCFSWANEPWTRSWDGQEKHVLMPQSYGGIDDIINHFKYLLSFFKDKRYIKIDNKPVFLLYRTSSITYINEMIDTWNTLSVENGFDGIYFIETLNSFSCQKFSEKTDAATYLEPMHVVQHKRTFFQKVCHIFRNPISRSHRINASYLWKLILKSESINSNFMGGGYIGWDNTPRRKNGYLVVTKNSPKIFYENFRKLYAIAKDKKSPFVFINAWNEWAEGTYLEPDEENGYAYLEAIKKIVEEFNE